MTTEREEQQSKLLSQINEYPEVRLSFLLAALKDCYGVHSAISTKMCGNI